MEDKKDEQDWAERTDGSWDHNHKLEVAGHDTAAPHRGEGHWPEDKPKSVEEQAVPQAGN